jgi:hypothetical protein
MAGTKITLTSSERKRLDAVMLVLLVIWLVAVFSMIARPAGAQERIWTNADLGKPLSASRPRISESELTGLTANQFKSLPEAPKGPTVFIMGSSSPQAGPWAFPPPAPARRLDGTLLDSPVTVYGSMYESYRRYPPVLGVPGHPHRRAR